MKLRRPLRCNVIMPSYLIQGRLPSVVRTVVAHYFRNAQPVVGEHTALAGGLRFAMLEMPPPSADRFVVAPELQRQQLALLIQAFEPLDRNEAVDLLDLAA